MNREQILSDYRGGDMDKRLRLFLAYRDLRTQFSSIDEDKGGRTCNSSSSLSLTKRALKKCSSFLQHLLMIQML